MLLWLSDPVVNSPWMEAFWSGFLCIRNDEFTWRSSIHLAFVAHMHTQTDASKLLATNLTSPHHFESLLEIKRTEGIFDVFLCHNGQDRAEVKQIGESLKELGILPWLDEWELRPGLPWQRLLEQQIPQIKAAAIFVGKDGLGPWQYQELDAFLREFVKRGCSVIPVLLANAFQKPELPVFLNGMTWVDFNIYDPNPMQQLVWGITGKRRASIYPRFLGKSPE